MVPTVIPASAAGDNFMIAFSERVNATAALQAAWSSLVFDYITRQKMSGVNLQYYIVKQVACPAPVTFGVTPHWSDGPLDAFVRPRVLELTYTSYRMRPYAVDVIGRDPAEPFHWLPDRRAQLMAELDAAMLHIYGLDRDAAEHVLDSFFVVRKYEERDFGDFRTKRLVLTEYDAMAKAAETGIPYRSPLDPPPSSGPRHPRRN